MKVWVFEHTSCIYESEFGLVSLHTTKQGAEKAKEKYIQGVKDKHGAEREQMEKLGYLYNHDPLSHARSRIREVTVED